MSPQSLSFSQSINAPITQVYRAFTSSTALRYWLCDIATVQPQQGGRLYLWWNSGYYTSGEFTALEPGSMIAFTWRGRGEPAETQVSVSLKEIGGAAHITLEHSGIGDGPVWAKATSEISEGWQMGLENLKSVLETGEDLRFTLRPMLGITVGDFNAEIAQKLGVPTSQAIRLDGVIPGMGAEAAGLKGDDVIVAMGEHPVTDFNSLTNALRRRRAGDKVIVSYFRDGEKRSTEMQLSHRRMPIIPWDPAELADAVSGQFREVSSELARFAGSITDAEASLRPSPDEWSVKETLAHLIHGQRGNLHFIPERIGGSEASYDDFFGNLNAQVEATVAAYPTLQDLVAEYQRGQVEIVELIKRLPKEFVANKSAYWVTAYELLEDQFHFPTHMEQMQKAVEAARG